jgi:UDP-2,3-diacylglucosamine pyrophosphatase LpxH
LAIEKKYDYVICGHIHEPKIEKKENKNGATLYLNSGDWVENLTALEYNKKRWKLYHYVEHSEKEEEDLFEMETLISQQLVASIIFSKQ